MTFSTRALLHVEEPLGDDLFVTVAAKARWRAEIDAHAASLENAGRCTGGQPERRLSPAAHPSS